MSKIIQIAMEGKKLVALTDTGKIYIYKNLGYIYWGWSEIKPPEGKG